MSGQHEALDVPEVRRGLTAQADALRYLIRRRALDADLASIHTGIHTKGDNVTERRRTSQGARPAAKFVKGGARGAAAARSSVATAPAGTGPSPTQRPRASAPVPGEGVGRRTVSMPQELLAEVDSRVGARGFSPYVAEAVRRQLRHDKLSEFLEQAEEAGGPITEAERSAARTAVAEAMAHAAAG